MTEQEEWQYNLLDDENKKKLNLVLDELKPYVGKELTILETISKENVNAFLTDNDIPIYPDFKESLNTPFAIMRYLSLFDEQEELTKKLDEFLAVNKTDDFDYFILKQFKNEVIFNVKDKGELKVKYIYDRENDKFDFYEVRSFIDMFNFADDEYVLLYARLLFPTYYFDIYDDIIIEILYKRLENKKEKIVSYILSKYS